MNKPHFIDSTLRDGEQTPGVCFSRKQKLDIAQRLDEIGISEIEAGTPIMGETVQKDIQSIMALHLHANISVWCRARIEDLHAAEKCGVKNVHIALPASDRLLSSMGVDFTWLCEQATNVFTHAASRFSYVSCGLMDASRCSLDRLKVLIQYAERSAVKRIRLADTVGIWNPAQVREVFLDIRKTHPLMPLGFHGHNDLGMATANALTAIQSGATYVDVTVNGLGDRAGNVPLAELVMALELSEKMNTGIRTAFLASLSHQVSAASKVGISPDKPVVGERIFSHESGIHVKALLKDRTSFQPYLPECVGQPSERIVIGSHSSPSMLRHLQLYPQDFPTLQNPLTRRGTYA
ncbi:hypothetical protein P3T73_10295 [Kiritimatiellota bacterium B12222]|nr:hypothetical protein P3T73_10295 [Kiritimatiellota bacterium B12222]